MIDSVTGLSILGSALLGKDFLVKLLGPTADYLGDELKAWTEKRHINLSNIFTNAKTKIGSKINDNGSVPPKVLKGILEEGSFCDEPLATEYFGGVLASSRSEVSRDDRGATIVALISRLSSYQLRAHYIFYHIVKNLFNDTELRLSISSDVERMGIYIPYRGFFTAMDFSDKENVNVITGHVLSGLAKENLINISYACGSKDHLQESFFKDAHEEGIITKPSPLGAELFLWAYGRGDLSINDVLKRDNQFDVNKTIFIPSDCMKINV